MEDEVKKVKKWIENKPLITKTELQSPGLMTLILASIIMGGPYIMSKMSECRGGPKKHVSFTHLLGGK